MENFDYRTLKAYTNHIQAVAGVERYQFTEGKAKGLEVAEVKTGAGLRYRVHLDRGMSLGEASFDGMNVASVSYTHLDVYKRQLVSYQLLRL